ncbi:hypothetical protein [Neoroseomonas rubea]|uniref:hypothetical protein n=1 Tax=Neoroseomonas rubea TaxID=2748666 RepID=UPI0018DF1393|nr:hypothetical protein [Roseomonas rubea]
MVPEVVLGYLHRPVAKNEKAAAILKKRTPTALYNTRGTSEGTWLHTLHRDLNAAMAAAYGWRKGIGEEHAREKLFFVHTARADGA